MEITIWIAKGLLSALFAFTGLYKLFLPKNKLLDKGMKGLINLNEKQIKGVGLLEIFGATGLILPTLLNIYPFLSVVAAMGLALTMIVAATMHHKLKISMVPNIAILAICLFVGLSELIL